jgi:hypothetical protein
MPARSSPPADPAVRVWTAMYEFVAGQDRRKPQRDLLDLGPGKVQLLVMLADAPTTLRDIAVAFGIDAPAESTRRRRRAFVAVSVGLCDAVAAVAVLSVGQRPHGRMQDRPSGCIRLPRRIG